MQIASLSRRTRTDALAVAFEQTAHRLGSGAQCAPYRSREVEFAVAIRIRAGKLEERAGGWMQYVRL